MCVPTLLLGYCYTLSCQFAAHFLGEFYDLASDRYNTHGSPLTGGSRILSRKSHTKALHRRSIQSIQRQPLSIVFNLVSNVIQLFILFLGDPDAILLTNFRDLSSVVVFRKGYVCSVGADNLTVDSCSFISTRSVICIGWMFTLLCVFQICFLLPARVRLVRCLFIYLC